MTQIFKDDKYFGWLVKYFEYHKDQKQEELISATFLVPSSKTSVDPFNWNVLADWKASIYLSSLLFGQNFLVAKIGPVNLKNPFENDS